MRVDLEGAEDLDHPSLDGGDAGALGPRDEVVVVAERHHAQHVELLGAEPCQRRAGILVVAHPVRPVGEDRLETLEQVRRVAHPVLAQESAVGRDVVRGDTGGTTVGVLGEEEQCDVGTLPVQDQREVDATRAVAETDVEQRRVRVEALDLVARLQPVGGRAHLEALSDQHLGQQRCHERLVLDDEETPSHPWHRPQHRPRLQRQVDRRNASACAAQALVRRAGCVRAGSGTA